MQHAHPPKKNRLTLWIGLGLLLGIVQVLAGTYAGPAAQQSNDHDDDSHHRADRQIRS